MPEELEESFLSLLGAIKASNTYQEYFQIEEKLKQNEEIHLLIEKIKEIQKQIVKEEYLKKDISTLEKEYEILLKKLETYPIYLSFLEKQKEVNTIFQTIKGNIEETFDKMITDNQ